MSLIDAAVTNLRAGDLSSARDAAERGLSATDPADDEYWRFVFVKADCLRITGNVREAIELLKTDLSDKPLSKEVIALWRMHRAYLLGMRNSYLEAQQEFDAADLVATQAGLKAVSLEILLRRAMILFFAEELVASQLSYRKALALARDVKDPYSEALAMAGTGKNLMIRKNYREAISWYRSALEGFIGAGANLLIAAMQSELGWCYYNLEQDDEALAMFRAAERVFLEAGAQANYQIALGNIGNIFVRRGDYPTAISYFQRALKIAEKNRDRVSMEKWLNNLSDAFFRLGNPVSAGEYQRKCLYVRAELQRERDRVRSTQD